MEGWHDYLIVNAGAAAALAGFVFVGLSLNLSQLLKFPAVLLRAASALVMLLSVLVTTSLMLVPGLSLRAIGTQVFIVGALSWMVVTVLSIRNVRAIATEYRGRAWMLFCMRQLAVAPVPIGGIVIVTGHDDGLYWLVPAFVLTYVVALIESWVILVEIER